MSTITAAKERPILFSASMVRAILEDQKKQTRRVVKLPDLQPWQLAAGVQRWEFSECFNSLENCDNFIAGFLDKIGNDCLIKSPYGKPADPAFDRPADRLWVREAFCIESNREVTYEPPFDDGRPIRHHNDEHWGPWWQQPHYRATDPTPELEVGTDDPGVKWRPSIFMPRWASRILLEITAIRVERLQDISEADARAEGIAKNQCPDWHALMDYQVLWESINGPGSWAANPWVWVVEFRRVQP
jgi:hypothetical protein